MPDVDITDMPVWDGEHACWFVKRTTHWRVEIFEMIYNYRIVLSRVNDHSSYERAWCYFGTDPTSFARAIFAARNFDPECQEAPADYDKALLE